MADLTPYWQGLDGTIRLYHGDCLAVMATLADASIDAVITDPQYGLADLSPATVLQAITSWVSGDRAHVPDGRGFMGRAWDSFVPPPAVWDECMRILKPGGHVLAFAGSRTVDLATLSIRLAGFEIRDTITWIGSQGFPKSHNVAKAIDRLLGAEREVIGKGINYDAKVKHGGTWTGDVYAQDSYTGAGGPLVTAPATPEAKQWDGWGTALKPASEPIIVARKPLAGTVAQNVLEYGTGALHIDACLVDGAPRPARTNKVSASGLTGTGGASTYGSFAVRGSIAIGETAQGRWPANVVFSHADGCRPAGTRQVKAGNSLQGSPRRGKIYGDAVNQDGPSPHYADADGMETVTAWACVPGCPVAELDAQAGPRTSGANPERRSADKFRDAYGEFKGEQACIPARGADTGSASRFFPVFKYAAKAGADERPRLEDGTAHVAVKPSELMEWLVKLVVPQGALVLDPFAGTGTTGRACAIEGMQAILIEQDEAHCQLAVQKLSRPVQQALFPGL